jgi:hypothetical protein
VGSRRLGLREKNFFLTDFIQTIVQNKKKFIFEQQIVKKIKLSGVKNGMGTQNFFFRTGKGT